VRATNFLVHALARAMEKALGFARMQDLNWPLIVAAIAFGTFILWQVRPALSRERAANRVALREAQKRIEEAKDDQARALALCDAGDASAKELSSGRAVAFYLRAMRTNPSSAELVERAATALARRPRALESLLWRRLAAEPWRGASEAAARAALRHLVRLYSGPLRQSIRAKAIENALSAMDREATPRPSGRG
jgi:hypothetical protein